MDLASYGLNSYTFGIISGLIGDNLWIDFLPCNNHNFDHSVTILGTESCLDVLAMGAWAAMLVRYWLNGKLMLLLHPDYAWLSNTAAVVLIALTSYKLFRIFGYMKGQQSTIPENEGHMRFLPGNLSSAVLLAVAVFGLIYTPRAFASETAVDRGAGSCLRSA